MNGMMQNGKGHEKNVDTLISMVKEKGLDPFSKERGSLLYQLEAEEIDLKKLEAHA